MLHRPPPAIAEVQNREMLRQIEALGETGDWLIIRGYKVMDDALSAMSGGPLSHAAILDKEKGVVIEAERIGVHSTTLQAYIAKSHRIVLVRPFWAKGGAGADAVSNAYAHCGKRYNYMGILFQAKDPSRQYCTELVVNVYQKYFRPEDTFEAILMPMAMLAWGRVVWDSGPRD
jgi:hypothetical protein